MTHLSITQSGLMALVSQVAAFVAGFGVINSVEEGVLISAAAAVVNAAFLVANAVHHLAHAQAQQVAVVVPPSVPPLV